MNHLKSMWLLCSGKERAIQAAARVVQDAARAHGSTVSLFAAVEGTDEDLLRTALGRQLKQLLHDSKELQLAGLRYHLETQLGRDPVHSMLVDAPAAWHALTAHAIQHRPELVVVPADADSVHPAFGSTSQHLFRKCPAAVWALTPAYERLPKRVLAAVDPGIPGSDNRRLSRAVLRFASRLCAPLGAQLHVVHAWRAWGETVTSPRLSRAAIAEYVELERATATTHFDELIAETEAGGALSERHLVKGEPEAAIARLTKTIDADVVVIGSAARTGLRGFFMGSVAETVLDRLECSAIVVKHPDFVSPVEAP